MKNIKIVFSRNKHIGSKILQWHQRCVYSHVEVIDEEEGGIIGARPCGVKRFDIKSIDKLEHETCLLSVTDDQYNLFFAFLRNKIGEKYDWTAYLGFILNSKNYQRSGRWFCSELVYAALQYAGVFLYQNLDAWNVMPRDFYIHRDIVSTKR